MKIRSFLRYQMELAGDKVLIKKLVDLLENLFVSRQKIYKCGHCRTSVPARVLDDASAYGWGEVCYWHDSPS